MNDRRSESTRVIVKPPRDEWRDPNEFEHARQAERRHDPKAWREQVRARAQLAVASGLVARPPVESLRELVTARPAVLLHDDGRTSRVSPVREDPFRGPGHVGKAVRVPAIRSEAATLVVRAEQPNASSIEPESYRLFRWDERSNQPVGIVASGTDSEAGAVWGRVSDGGVYGVVGLPTDPHRTAHKRLGRVIAAELSLVRRLACFTAGWVSVGPGNITGCALDVAVDPYDANRLYAAMSDGGVWMLDDMSDMAARGWRPLTDGQPSLKIKAFALSPSDSRVLYYIDESGSLYRSDNRGSSWDLANPISVGQANRIVVSPYEHLQLWVASNTGLWASNDGGSTWRAGSISSRTLRNGDIRDVEVDPSDPAVLYAGEAGTGLLKSTDGGQSWRTILSFSAATNPSSSQIKVAVGHQGTDATRTVAVRFAQEVFVNHKGGWPRSRLGLGGEDWQSKGLVGEDGYGLWCHVLAIDPRDDRTILSGSQRLHRSTQGGDNWVQVIDYGQPHEDQHRVAFDPAHAGIVYAANDGGIFRSSDGGETWSTTGDSTPGFNLNEGLVAAQFYAAGVAGSVADGNVYHSGHIGTTHLTTGPWRGIQGHSWEGQAVHGDPVRGEWFWVLKNDALWRQRLSAAGPDQFGQVGAFVPSSIAFVRPPAQRAVLVGTAGGQIMRSTDPDAAVPTWAGIAAPTRGLQVTALAVDPAGTATGYAGLSGGEILSTSDAVGGSFARTGMLTSTPVALAVSPNDPMHVFAITASSVFRSPNGGSTWTPIMGQPGNQLPYGSEWRSLLASWPGVLWVASRSGVYTSPDEGSTWYSTTGLPNVEIRDLFDDGGIHYLATHGRGLWRYDARACSPFDGFSLDLQSRVDIDWLVRVWLAIHGGDPAEALAGVAGELQSRPLG